MYTIYVYIYTIYYFQIEQDFDVSFPSLHDDFYEDEKQSSNRSASGQVRNTQIYILATDFVHLFVVNESMITFIYFDGRCFCPLIFVQDIYDCWIVYFFTFFFSWQLYCFKLCT